MAVDTADDVICHDLLHAIERRMDRPSPFLSLRRVGPGQGPA
jgi:hypothetical protein